MTIEPKTHFATNCSISRRTMLRGTGIAMALPWLDSMVPAFAKTSRVRRAVPRRFVAVSNGLGFHGLRDHAVRDRTMLLLTSNLGNASSHDTKNMPVLFAGGGFKHGQHLAFDRKNNYPLPNLYTSMLQRLGLEIESFASATGTMKGLEFKS